MPHPNLPTQDLPYTFTLEDANGTNIPHSSGPNPNPGGTSFTIFGITPPLPVGAYTLKTTTASGCARNPSTLFVY